MAGRGMYRAPERPPASAKHLEQGDILVDLPVPELVTRESLHKREGMRCDPWGAGPWPKQDEPIDRLRVLSRLTRWKAIVLTNSCDVFGGQLPIQVAPVRPFMFHEPTLRREILMAKVEDILAGLGAGGDEIRRAAREVRCSERSAVKALLDRAVLLAAHSGSRESIAADVMKEYELPDAERWRQINDAATGTTTTKSFYLPAYDAGSLVRSLAHFPEAYPLSHSYMDRCLSEAGTRRICGLKPEAQRHLQWALGLMFSRNAREDEAWPSREDLELKRIWLRREIERGGARREEHIESLERVDRLLEEEMPPEPDQSSASRRVAETPQAQ